MVFDGWSAVIKQGQDFGIGPPLCCPSAAHGAIIADVVRRVEPLVDVVSAAYIVEDGPPPQAKAATNLQRAK